MSSRSEKLPSLHGHTPMAELMQSFPGARRALFARYHIGGCSSCGFRDDETLEEVCVRNENLPVNEVVDHILQSHENDAKMQVSPTELAALIAAQPDLKILDVRSREEHEAVALPGSQLMSQDLTQTIFGTWDKEAPLIIYDHTGERSLDATAYFIGHGFKKAKCLAGGIDAYSIEVDTSLPRYRVEFED